MDPIARRFPKLEPNESPIYIFIFFSFKNVKKSKLSNLKPIAPTLPKLKPNEMFAEIISYDTKLYYMFS